MICVSIHFICVAEYLLPITLDADGRVIKSISRIVGSGQDNSGNSSSTAKHRLTTLNCSFGLELDSNGIKTHSRIYCERNKLMFIANLTLERGKQFPENVKQF
jgi:hypothetical protein